MQAVGVLKPHQEDLPGHPWLPPEPARRRWLLTYRLHAGRAEEDKRPCGVGEGQNRTEETSKCLALQKQATPSFMGTMASHDLHNLANTCLARTTQGTGTRAVASGSLGNGDTLGLTHAERGRLSIPAHPHAQACTSPSFTEMVGFFCRSPNRMKKRTSGMKISKARTHWKGWAT